MNISANSADNLPFFDLKAYNLVELIASSNHKVFLYRSC
jgi:hypothetical protein